jgi:6-phosphofructokinase 1
VILIPEIPYDIERVCDKVREREARGRRFSIVVVAEGARPQGGHMLFKEPADALSEHGTLGGIAEHVARQIHERTRKETRSLVLGHLQRGGSPVMSDRVLALRLGCAATRFLDQTERSGLVAVRQGGLELVPLSDATGPLRTVPPDSEIVQAARDLGLCFGDESEQAFKPIPPTSS